MTARGLPLSDAQSEDDSVSPHLVAVVTETTQPSLVKLLLWNSSLERREEMDIPPLTSQLEIAMCSIFCELQASSLFSHLCLCCVYSLIFSVWPCVDILFFVFIVLCVQLDRQFWWTRQLPGVVPGIKFMQDNAIFLKVESSAAYNILTRAMSQKNE